MNMTKPISNEILSYNFEAHAWHLDFSKELEVESHIILPNGKTISSSILKQVYPELVHWRPQQIVAAMQQYFSAVYYTDWIEMENLRELEFLAWLYDFQEKAKTSNPAYMTHVDLISGEIDKAAEKLWTQYGSSHFVEYVVKQESNAIKKSLA
jgi:hypothetical protein